MQEKKNKYKIFFLEIYKTKLKRYVLYVVSILFWICIWQVTAMIINNELFLPYPENVCKILYKELLWKKDFCISIMTSLLHIVKGFMIGCITGIVFALFSYFIEVVRILLWFPIKLIKTVPVASFVILTLLWVNVSELSTFISFIMTMPILYVNTLNGIECMDTQLMEMTQVFNVSQIKKIRYLYIPQILPYISSAASLAISMSWKSGIAAEIIGLVQGTIGNRLYQSKIYLDIPELFAWTIVIIILSVLCEWIIKGIMNICIKIVR